MSLFDNTKIPGWALFFAGLLMIISALIGFYDAFAEHDGAGDITGYIIVAVGSLLAGLVYFGFGNSVRSGSITNKLDIVSRMVLTVAICTIINAFFSLIGQVLIEVQDYGALGMDVVYIILGIVLAWIANKIGDGKVDTIDKIMWIILVVVFLVLFVVSLLAILPIGLTSIEAVLMAIIYVFLLVFMFDDEVKNKML